MSEGTYKILSLLMEERASLLVDLCLENGDEQTSRMLESLEGSAAAQLLERLPAWFGGMALSRLDDAMVSKLLNLAEASKSARLLRSLATKRRQVVLDKLEPRHAKTVASFAVIDESKIGSVVQSAAMSIEEGTPVSTVMDLVRQHPGRVLDYLYVVSEATKLVGVVPIKKLLLAEATQNIDSLATLNPDKLRIDDSLAQSAAHPRWRRAKVMPVVDQQDCFAGVVARMDLPGTRISETALQDASQALAESFGIGLIGLLRLLSAGAGNRR